jgi:KaiC/GvpD/RAD55 family RecA-like ATPase
MATDNFFADSERYLLQWLKALLPVDCPLPFPLCALSPEKTTSSIIYPRSMAILGTPGSGKSTLGMQLACLAAAKCNKKVAIVGIEQRASEIFNLVDIFGWKAFLNDHIKNIDLYSADILPFGSDFKKETSALETPFFVQSQDNGVKSDAFTNLKEVLKGHSLLLLDGIGSLSITSDIHRQNWVRFLEECKQSYTFPILIGDETIGEPHFLEYIVDSVFRIQMNGLWRNLFMHKVRYIPVVHPGPHIVKIWSTYLGKCSTGGIEIIPNPCALIEPLDRSEDGKADVAKNIRFGVRGYSTLFRAEQPEELVNSESILLVGNPGTGKTNLMLSFLAEAGKDEKGLLKVLLVSIDRREDSIKNSLSTVDEKSSIRKLNDLFDTDRVATKQSNRLLSFLSANCTAEEVISRLLISLDRMKTVTRVAFCGLEALFDVIETASEQRRLMGAFLGALRNRGVISLFVFDLPGWFVSIADMPSRLFELFDTVLITGMREEMNRTVNCIQAISSRGKKANGSLLRLIYDLEGSKIDNTPWQKAGLISGDPAAITNANIFLKLFYENPGELFINRLYLDKLKDRYPNKEDLFSLVFKEMPTPDHFSFRAYGGAAHSNIKVLLLRKAVLDVIAKDERIENLKELIPISFRDEIDSSRSQDPGWNRSEDIRQWKMIPCYFDVPMLIIKKRWAKEIELDRPDAGHAISINDIIKARNKYRRGKGIRSKYFMTLPSLVGRNRSAVVALLLVLIEEIAASSGKKRLFYNECKRQNKDPKRESDRVKNIKEHYKSVIGEKQGAVREALLELYNLVDGEKVPNPLEGRMYRDSALSWRWNASVEDYGKDEETFDQFKKEEKPLYAYRDVVVRSLSKLDYGTIGSISHGYKKESCMVGELYCLSVLKGALAPETGWYLIHDLIQPPAPDLRIGFKRGWPVRGEHFLTMYKEKGERTREWKYYERFREDLCGSIRTENKKPRTHLMSDYEGSFYLELALIKGLQELFGEKGKKENSKIAVDRAKNEILRSPFFLGESSKISEFSISPGLPKSIDSFVAGRKDTPM